MIKRLQYLNPKLLLLITLSVCLSLPLFADLADAEKAEQQARKEFDKRYKDFTLDRNVMGKARDTSGKIYLEGTKVQFDKDDAVSYKSYLTYHDFSFRGPDDAYNNKNKNSPPDPKKPNSRELTPFVSPHGAQDGDSSELEKEMYKLHDKYANEKPDPKKKKEEGVDYETILKVETKEIKPKDIQSGTNTAGNAAGGSTGGAAATTAGGTTAGGATAGGTTAGADTPEDKDKLITVERYSLRPDVKEAAEKIGTRSFETIDQASKEEGKKNDANQMGNVLLLQDAAGRATESWWNSTLANLGQSNAVSAFAKSAAYFNQTKLSEGVATCEAGIAQIRTERLKDVKDAKRIQEIEEELKKQTEMCKEVTKMPYNVVNPRYVDKKADDGKVTTKLEVGKPDDENAFGRDLRNQLEVLRGKTPTDLPSNWKYSPNENKAKVVLEYDENGKAKEAEEMTMQEQADEYNSQLEEAAKGFKEVKKRFPTVSIEEDEIPKAFRIDKVDPIEVNKYRNVKLLNEESGNQMTDVPIAETYDQLLENTQK